MFRPRGSFDFVARIHIFYLFLVFAVHGKASDATATVFNEFGCEFSDNDYSMKLADNKQPVWSNRQIDSRYKVDDFVNIDDPFKKLFSEVNIMNTLSQFTELVKYHRVFTTDNFQNYFNNYKVPFQHKKEYYDKKKVGGVIRKTQDPASYLIQELHTLQESLKKQKAANQNWIFREAGNKGENTPLITPYLVSAYVDPIEVNFSKYYLHHIAPDVSLEKLHGKRVQDHLAGIIPICIGNRTGYILIDPGYANGEQQMFLPFVAYVMNDEKTPHGDYIHGTKSSRKELQFAVKDNGKGNPFILARHHNPHHLHSEIIHVIYSVGKPYCSFMENTIKSKLVRPYHEIIKVDNEILKGYLDFKITSGSNKFSKNIFTETSVTNLEPNEEFKMKIRSMFFTNSSSSEEVSVIIDQFKFIQRHLFDRNEFVTELTGFTKSLGLDPEPENSVNKSVVAETLTQPSIGEKIAKLFKKMIPCSQPKTIDG